MTLYTLRASRRILRGLAVIFRSPRLQHASHVCAELAWYACGSPVAGYTPGGSPRAYVTPQGRYVWALELRHAA